MSWPATLPQTPLISGYNEQPEDSRLISEVDAGPRKFRNRYTANSTFVSETYQFTEAEYETFLDWYKNTISNGADSFTKTHPITNALQLYRFRGQDTYKLVSVNWPYYQVQLSLEVLAQ